MSEKAIEILEPYSFHDDLAQNVATAAFCPGGIDIFGLHFEAESEVR